LLVYPDFVVTQTFGVLPQTARKIVAGETEHVLLGQRAIPQFAGGTNGRVVAPKLNCDPQHKKLDCIVDSIVVKQLRVQGSLGASQVVRHPAHMGGCHSVHRGVVCDVQVALSEGSEERLPGVLGSDRDGLIYQRREIRSLSTCAFAATGFRGH